MNAHHDHRRDPDAATEQTRFREEWDRQFLALPQTEREMIVSDPLGVLAEGLFYSVERALRQPQEP